MNTHHACDRSILGRKKKRNFGLPLTGFSLRVAGVLFLPVIVASSFYLSSSASQIKVVRSPQAAGIIPTVSEARLPRWMEPRTSMLAPLTPVPPPTAPTITIYNSNCSTPQTVFNVQDTDKTVCAKVTDATPGYRLLWSNAKFVLVQNVPVTSSNQTSTFTLSTNSSTGDWRVILFEPFGGTVQALTAFTVIDAENPSADLSISKNATSSMVTAGAQVVFAIQVNNNGPSTSNNVQLTDAVPTGTTMKSFAQLSGPVFNCTSPPEGGTGTTTCTVGSMNKDDVATFLATYLVDGNAQNGTTISNTINVTSTTPATPDPNADNNSSTATAEVANAPCVLSCPSDIDVNADTGQAGAIVTYTEPGHTGNCGTTGTGEDGETTPIVSCSVASGSFFPVGVTTVVCAAQTGEVCTFQVTVQNPGGLSISVHGANPLTIECGNDFSDPGASAVNATGQSVPVTVTYSTGFNADAPAAGSYTATYTATEGANSVSATRTINVTDTAAPSITLNGANPYRIITGSCIPFTDPGATANDGCAGPVAVTSSILGPGGVTSVNNSVPGTYTVTYTATDGTRSATATRTVLVGNFSQDDSDQPDTGNQPPTITLNGDDQITIECGTPFTDPGATAGVCGGSVPVTATGTVDIHSPGTYTINYSATANGQTATATRIVTVSPDNTAPTIQVLGANPMTVECHTSFTDPGATAHDACAGDFAATATGTVNPNVVGTYLITYNATDPSRFSASPVIRVVNVVDTTSPVVTAPANVTVYTGPSSTTCAVVVSDATLGAASASDSCQGSLPVTRTGVPAGNAFPVGTTTITYSATDASNNTGTATQTVTVIDNTVPVITTNGQTPALWPPNHRYQTFQVTNFVTSASDNCTNLSAADVVIDKVTSDEAENGNGSGNTVNDIVIGADCKSVQLRAEREGTGDGRVYTITFKVTDASGNVGYATAKVVVAHNPGETPVDSGVHYTVNGTCP